MIKELWNSTDDRLWREAESKYDSFLTNDEKRARDERMDAFSINDLRAMNVENFYNWLHDEFFVWKYTAKNRLASTRKNLTKYITEDANYGNLGDILDALKNADNFDDIASLLTVAHNIKGLGFAGATALLSVIYPGYFGTCDQFVAKGLTAVNAFKECECPRLKLNPNSLTLEWCVLMEKIMREKADVLNKVNNTTYWTPRKIDKVLFANRDK